ncbi:MAG: hypothetical protein ACRDHY_09895 [Anaerolineales bacterium]
MTPGVIEWAPFRLADGVSEDRLLAASRELQDAFLARQLGFVRRELLRGKDGEWVDLVEWTDRPSAEAVTKAAAASPACLSYFRLMVGGSEVDPANGVSHFDRVAAYER